jgi:hypothetical protein
MVRSPPPPLERPREAEACRQSEGGGAEKEDGGAQGGRGSTAQRMREGGARLSRTSEVFDFFVRSDIHLLAFPFFFLQKDLKIAIV